MKKKLPGGTLFEGAATDEELIEELLNGPEDAQLMGRLLATGMPKLIQNWINDELQRGTHPSECPATLVKMTAQAIGSFMEQALPEGTDFSEGIAIIAILFWGSLANRVGASPEGAFRALQKQVDDARRKLQGDDGEVMNQIREHLRKQGIIIN